MLSFEVHAMDQVEQSGSMVARSCMARLSQCTPTSRGRLTLWAELSSNYSTTRSAGALNHLFLIAIKRTHKPSRIQAQASKDVHILKYIVLLYSRTSRFLSELVPNPRVHCSFFDFRLQDSVNERTSLIAHQDMCVAFSMHRISLTLQ